MKTKHKIWPSLLWYLHYCRGVLNVTCFRTEFCSIVFAGIGNNEGKHRTLMRNQRKAVTALHASSMKNWMSTGQEVEINLRRARVSQDILYWNETFRFVLWSRLTNIFIQTDTWGRGRCTLFLLWCFLYLFLFLLCMWETSACEAQSAVPPPPHVVHTWTKQQRSQRCNMKDWTPVSVTYHRSNCQLYSV